MYVNLMRLVRETSLLISWCRECEVNEGQITMAIQSMHISLGSKWKMINEMSCRKPLGEYEDVAQVQF